MPTSIWQDTLIDEVRVSAVSVLLNFLCAPLRSLCLDSDVLFRTFLTTKALRTQRLHRVAQPQPKQITVNRLHIFSQGCQSSTLGSNLRTPSVLDCPTQLLNLSSKNFAYPKSLCFNPRRLVISDSLTRLGRTCVL